MGLGGSGPKYIQNVSKLCPNEENLKVMLKSKVKAMIARIAIWQCNGVKELNRPKIKITFSQNGITVFTAGISNIMMNLSRLNGRRTNASKISFQVSKVVLEENPYGAK